MSHNSQEEILRLIQLDLDRTGSFIAGLMERQAAARGLAVTIWAAVLGFAFDRLAWELGLLAAAAVVVFSFLDGYYTLLYMDAREHSGRLENIVAAYCKSLVRPDDEDTVEDLQVDLEAYQFGLYRRLTLFRVKDLLKVRKRVMFRVFYPFLAIAAVLACILIGVRA
jgi:hypothetical protein